MEIAAEQRRTLSGEHQLAHTPAMSENNKSGFSAELALLERRVEELLLTIETLKEENRALRQRQESLAAERSTFAQRNDQVRARVEAMIGRLKTMEHTA